MQDSIFLVFLTEFVTFSIYSFYEEIVCFVSEGRGYLVERSGEEKEKKKVGLG